MKLPGLLLAVASVGAVMAPPALAHGQLCAVLYEDANYGGHAYIAWGLNAASSYLGGYWNDRISSVVVGDGCHLTLWLDANYQGLSVAYDRSTPFVGESVNDKASSFNCTCSY